MFTTKIHCLNCKAGDIRINLHQLGTEQHQLSLLKNPIECMDKNVDAPCFIQFLKFLLTPKRVIMKLFLYYYYYYVWYACGDLLQYILKCRDQGFMIF